MTNGLIEPVSIFADEVSGNHYLQPPSAARVEQSRVITTEGREVLLSEPANSFGDGGDAFIYDSVFTAEKPEELMARFSMFTKMAQWHSVPKNESLDLFRLYLLGEAEWQGQAVGGFAFAFPVQFHPMPNGFAFLVHQDVFRVEIEDKGNLDNASVETELIEARNNRLDFRMPSTLQVVSKLQSDSDAFKQQVRFNLKAGASAKELATIYDRDEDTMRHHMNKAFRDGVIKSNTYVRGQEELLKFRDWMSEPGRVRQPRTGRK